MIKMTSLFFLLVPVNALIAASPRTPPEKTVFYVDHSSNSYDFKLTNPMAGDMTLASIHYMPTNIFWLKDFSTMYYRAQESIYKLAWKQGALPVEIMKLPPATRADGILWLDSETQVWHLYETIAPGPGDKFDYKARVYDYDKQQAAWKVTVEKETHGCESGDSAFCGSEVADYLKSMKRLVFLTDLFDSMGIEPQLRRLGKTLDETSDGSYLFIPSAQNDTVGIEVKVAFGDTGHAVTPIRWRNNKDGTSQAIYPDVDSPNVTESSCSRQVSLQEFDRWFLVTSEYTGGCGRIIETRSGKIVFTLPEYSSDAVLVPNPV